MAKGSSKVFKLFRWKLEEVKRIDFNLFIDSMEHTFESADTDEKKNRMSDNFNVDMFVNIVPDPFDEIDELGMPMKVEVPIPEENINLIYERILERKGLVKFNRANLLAECVGEISWLVPKVMPNIFKGYTYNSTDEELSLFFTEPGDCDVTSINGKEILLFWVDLNLVSHGFNPLLIPIVADSWEESLEDSPFELLVKQWNSVCDKLAKGIRDCLKFIQKMKKKRAEKASQLRKEYEEEVREKIRVAIEEQKALSEDRSDESAVFIGKRIKDKIRESVVEKVLPNFTYPNIDHVRSKFYIKLVHSGPVVRRRKGKNSSSAVASNPKSCRRKRKGKKERQKELNLV